RPGALREALGEQGAARAEALHLRERHLAPCTCAHTRDEIVTIAGRGLLRPLAQPQDLAAEALDRTLVARAVVVVERVRSRARVREIEERGPGLLRIPAGDLVAAQVVLPPLEERDPGRPRKVVREGARDERQVTCEHLALKGEG